MDTKREKITENETHLRKRTGKTAAVILACVFLVLFISGALAADGDPVETIANPANTTIDVFDFWVYDNRGTSAKTFFTTGINLDHTLYFSSNRTAELWNKYTGEGKGCFQGIVQRRLGEDGYPILAVGDQEDPESLAFLFDASEFDDNGKPAKRSYMGANYLLTVDENGYYAFDSAVHKAILDKNTHYFDVTEQSEGGFWPLSQTENDKYFFGVHLKSEFSIPADRKVLNPAGEYQDMVYEFRGDDDVWMFIDGVLVGDVGGIHNAHALTVNFATGKVCIWNAKKPGYRASTYIETTIYEMFREALGEEAAQRDFQWKEEPDGTYKTLAGGTYHTMDFFYLERGAGNSNMEVHYNMISTYDFTGHKTLRNADPSVTTVLQRDQFKYRLTGFPIEIDQDGLKWLEAVMPVTQSDMNVTWMPDYGLYPLTLENQKQAQRGNTPKTLLVGNSADGNINFGSLELRSGEDSHDTVMELYMDRTFRYIYEELPPDGADLNADGKSYTWKGKTVYPNEDGSYTFDGVAYDLTKYYFEGKVTPEGWVKHFYKDDEYTVPLDIGFVNYENRSLETTLTVSKQVVGSQGDRNQKFNYTLTVPEKAGETLYYTKNGRQPRSSAKVGKNGTFSFTLKHGESIEFYGIRETYTVAETGYGDYRVCYQLDGGEEVQESVCSRPFDLTDLAETVVFTNILSRDEVEISGNKILLGRDMTEDKFTFILTQADAEGKALPEGIVLTASVGAGAEHESVPFTFSPIAYTYSDYAGAEYRDADGNAIFYYIAGEVIPPDAADHFKEGILYSREKFLVRVTLRYNEEDKSLSARWTVYPYDGNGIPENLKPAGTPAGGG